MPLSQQKIDDVWYSGFCVVTCEHAAGTEFDDGGREIREAFMREHVKTCPICRCALRWKNIELAVAQRMHAADVYYQGGDISKLPDFGPALKEELDFALAQGKLSRKDMRMVPGIIARRLEPCPVRAREEAGS